MYYEPIQWIVKYRIISNRTISKYFYSEEEALTFGVDMAKKGYSVSIIKEEAAADWFHGD